MKFLQKCPHLKAPPQNTSPSFSLELTGELGELRSGDDSKRFAGFVIETNIGKVYHFSLVLSLLKNYSLMTVTCMFSLDTQPTFSDLQRLGTVSCLCWPLEGSLGKDLKIFVLFCFLVWSFSLNVFHTLRSYERKMEMKSWDSGGPAWKWRWYKKGWEMAPTGSVLDPVASEGQLVTKHLLSFGEQVLNMLRQKFYLLPGRPLWPPLLLTSDPSG